MLMNKTGMLATAVLLTSTWGVSAQAAWVSGDILPSTHNYDKLSIAIQSFLDGAYTRTTGTDAVTKIDRGVKVNRLYLDVRYYVNKTWMYRFTSDVNNEQPSGAGLKRNENVFLKYGYLQGNFSPELQLRLGLSHTPMIAWAQDTWWQHRYVSKIMIDRLGYDNSSDAGVGFKGKLASGLFGYWATLTNGGGYSKPGVTSKMDFDLRGTVYPMKGLNISYQIRSGYRGTAGATKTTTTYTYDTASGKLTPHDETTTVAEKSTLNHVMASYGNGNKYRVGVNVAQNIVKRDSDGLQQKHRAKDIWGFYNFSDYGVMARYERETVNPFASSDAIQKQTHYVAALEYRYNKAVRSSLVYTKTKFDNYKYQSGDTWKSDSIAIKTQFLF